MIWLVILGAMLISRIFGMKYEEDDGDARHDVYGGHDLGMLFPLVFHIRPDPFGR